MPYKPDKDHSAMMIDGQGHKAATSPSKFRAAKPVAHAKPHSATRKNCPQNERVFKTSRLPNGSHVSYFAVPGEDDHTRGFKSYEDESMPDLVSTQRHSFTLPVKKSTHNTRRYGCNEQPWALPTITHHDLGLSTNSYEHSLTHRTTMGRKVRTAPAAVGFRGTFRGGRDMEDDVATITSADATAMSAMMSYYSEASRLEQTVLAQMFKRVSSDIQFSRSQSQTAMSGDDSGFMGTSRPGTQQNRMDLSSRQGGKKPAWKI